ncbi:MAG TPA: protein kinase, partial [Gemmatimonadales bacterium]|nr:protein kinase [Gemmatimonadales bacterium]
MGIPTQLADALRDRYAIERELGRGGMATVYLAQDSRHHRRVAIKVLHPQLAQAVGPERFLHEIEIIAQLQHPHILPLHDSGEGGGLLYFVMPYVAGESLRNRLARERQLPLDQALEIARQVASALAYAHSHGVVHRDIKPENILLMDDQAIVADFGIAWAVGQSGGERLTETGLTLGTPAYMSPEQAAGERHLDGRSDIYSLACVVYEMLAGEPPFTGPTAQAVLARRFGGPPPRLHVIRDGVPEGMERAIDHALAKAPADRFSTALQFSAALSAPAGAFSQPPNLAPTARVVEGPSPALVPSPPDTVQPRSKHLAQVAALVVCVLGLAILDLRLTRPSPPAPSVSPKAIAVLPFLYRGSSEFSYLGEAMVELLSVKLEGATGLRPVDARTLLTFASREGRIADPSHGAQVARRFGSGLFVLGSITEAGGRLSVSATVYEVGGRTRNTFETLAGGEEEIFDLADRLGRQILAEAQDEPLQFARVAGQTTTSLPALKVYLEGEREQRAGRTKTAEEAFHRAVELDTSFALAYYRLAGFYFNDVPKAQEAVDRALRHSDRLGEHHRGLLLAMAAWLRGDHTAADQQYRLILAAHPDDAEAWNMLGELALHKGHLLGRAWVDARAAYERVLALDPGSAWSLWWLAAIAAREGRRTDLDSLTDRFLQLKPHPDYAATARAQRAVALGDTAGEARFVAELRTRPDREAQASGGFVTWTTGNLRTGRRLWRLIAEPSRSVGMRLRARLVLAKIELTN